MAAMEAVRPRVGYSDLQQMPEDGRRYELYDGEVFVVPAPLPRHQRVVIALVRNLDQYVKTRGGEVLLSPIDIVFSDFDVLQPDVVFFTVSRQHHVKADEPIRVPPDLAIEVISPSSAQTDRGKKMQMYSRYGVTEYWIVDPGERRVEVYRLAGRDFALVHVVAPPDVVHSAVVANLEISTSELFDV